MELYKEGDVYYVRFYTEQGQRTRSTKATTLEDAKAVVKAARIAELENAARAKALNAEALTAIMAGRRVTCDEVVNEWEAWRRTAGASENTIRTQLYVLRALIDGIEGKPIGTIKAERINELVNERDKTSLANRRLRLAAIRSMFKFASARAYVVGNPAAEANINRRMLSHEQKEAKKRVPFTKAEFDKVVAGTEGFFRHATVLSYWAGLRLSDIANLEWASFDGDSIIVHTQKTGARVSIPMSEPLIGSGTLALTVLSMMESDGQGKYCFPRERRLYNEPASRGGFSVRYGRLLTRLGIEGKSFHCLRHAFVTRLAKAGKSLEEIGSIVGHSDTKTTAGYSHEQPVKR